MMKRKNRKRGFWSKRITADQLVYATVGGLFAAMLLSWIPLTMLYLLNSLIPLPVDFNWSNVTAVSWIFVMVWMFIDY